MADQNSLIVSMQVVDIYHPGGFAQMPVVAPIKMATFPVHSTQ